MSAATHEFLPEEVMAFLDGELSLERSAAFSKHLETCAECSAAATTQRSLSQRMTTWQVGPIPTRLSERVTAATQTDSAKGESLPSWVPKRRHSAAFRWAVGITSGLAAVVLLLAIATPNLMRSKMAANEATKNSRERDAQLERFMARTPRGGLSVDNASVHNAPGNGRPISDQQSKIFTNLTPGVAADSNGLFHSVGDHGEYSFSGPMIARTVSLSIVVKDFEAGRASLDSILTRHNGYAANLNASTPQGAARTLQASLRIPAPQLASVLAELKALGRVEGESQNGEEVTQQHADLVARIKNDRETELRLQDILRTRTGKVKDILEVEQEIARVRGEIEQMEAEQKTLEHRVDFATIDLKLAEEYKAQLSSPAPSVLMQLRNATVNGFRNAFESLLGIVLFFAESGPTLVLWLTILAIPAWLLWRRYRRAHALGSLVGA
jgi:hypothetical protein